MTFYSSILLISITSEPGEFGLYQRFLFVILMLFCFFLTFVYFTQLFLIVVPVEFWCEMPTVEGFTSEELRDYMIPSSTLVAYEGHDLPYSRCWIYDVPVKTAMEAKEPDPKWPMKKCDKWHFKTTPFDVPYISVAAEFGWVISSLIQFRNNNIEDKYK